MDSRTAVVDELIKTGEGFTFQNFSVGISQEYRTTGYSAGEDTLEWLTFKTRTRNFIYQNLAPQSPAIAVLKEAERIWTQKQGPDVFERAKGTWLKALTLARDALVDDKFGELDRPKAKPKSSRLSNKVFIVHGHDELLKTELESFLRSSGLDPIVLHRQPDQGKTLIEKFEHYSDVGYAFILLTPDDVGYAKAEEAKPDEGRRKEHRARQNVIFEFGFFVGQLDRSRVCCLYRPGVTIPSDIDGLVYKQISGSFDSVAYPVLKELKAAGYNVKL